MAPARDFQSAVAWRPGELWSLWDMINFMIPQYLTLLKLVQQETGVGLRKVAPLTDADKERITQNMQHVLRKADELELPTVRNRVERIFAKLRLNPQILALDIAHEMNIVLESFEDDTKFLYLYRYPREKAARYLRCQKDWDAAIKAFPLLKHDIEQALDLYALGHNMAAVFYLMRIMEVGVQRFGKKLGVSLIKLTANRIADLSWHQILDALNPKLKTINQATAAGKAKYEKYSAVQAYLYGVKDAWRNPTMHPRKTGYNDVETLNIINHVQSFMNELALIVLPKNFSAERS